jgi:hypothetical protein
MDNTKQILNILQPKKERKPKPENLFILDEKDRQKIQHEKLKTKSTSALQIKKKKKVKKKSY